MSQLFFAFINLPLPLGEFRDVRFSASRIANSSNRFVAKGSDGGAAIILESASARAPIELQNLSVEFGATCRLHFDACEEKTAGTIIRCLSSETATKRYFFMVMETLLSQFPASASANDLVAGIDELVALFQKLSRAPKKSAQGLFGELLLTELTTEPDSLIKAWHTDPFERFDFTADGLQVEVKTSTTRQRAHHFSLEQCEASASAAGFVFSMFVEVRGGGVSLEELMSSVASRITISNLVNKLYLAIADTLGQGLANGMSQRFDQRLALESLRVYDLSTIPAIRPPVPPFVTSVNFVSNLDSVGGVKFAHALSDFPALRALFN